LLLFNCGNLNTATGLQAGAARNLVRYRTWARGCSVVKNLQIETGIHKQFYSIGLGLKRQGREAENYQQLSPKMNDESAVADFTVRIAAAVKDSCALTFC